MSGSGAVRCQLRAAHPLSLPPKNAGRLAGSSRLALPSSAKKAMIACSVVAIAGGLTTLFAAGKFGCVFLPLRIVLMVVPFLVRLYSIKPASAGGIKGQWFSPYLDGNREPKRARRRHHADRCISIVRLSSVDPCGPRQLTGRSGCGITITVPVALRASPALAAGPAKSRHRERAHCRVRPVPSRSRLEAKGPIALARPG